MKNISVLNEISKFLKIKSEPIDIALKQEIYHQLFEKNSKVTGKEITELSEKRKKVLL